MIPEHIKYSLERWRIAGEHPGQFLMAVLRGDLFDAIARADAECEAALGDIVRYVCSQLPSGAWGRDSRLATWAVYPRSECSLDDAPYVVIGQHDGGGGIITTHLSAERATAAAEWFNAHGGQTRAEPNERQKR